MAQNATYPTFNPILPFIPPSTPRSFMPPFVSILSNVADPIVSCCKDPEQADDTPLVDAEAGQTSGSVSVESISRLLPVSEEIPPFTFSLFPPAFWLICFP